MRKKIREHFPQNVSGGYLEVMRFGVILLALPYTSLMLIGTLKPSNQNIYQAQSLCPNQTTVSKNRKEVKASAISMTLWKV